MITPQLVQLARLIGRDQFIEALGPPENITQLDAGLRQRLNALVDGRLDAITSALVETAAASDDVTSVAGAFSYAEDELALYADLLTPAQQEAILARFGEATAGWEKPTA